MKLKIPLTLGLFALSCIGVQAQSTVNFNAAPGQRDVWDSGSTGTLDTGNYVSVGYFDAGFDVNAFNSDLIALANAWHEYGSTTIQPVFGQQGRFAGTEYSQDPAFDDQIIYLWIFETSNDEAPSINYDNVVGYGIYTGSGDNWLFPSQGSAFPNDTTSVNSSEITTALYGSFDANHLYLQPIPEPVTLTLLCLGAFPLYWMSRRRS